MTKLTKEQLIEDLKASTQNSSGMFEIGEETICALMSMLTNAAPQLPQPAVLSVSDGVLKSLLPDAEKPDFWFEHNGKIFFEGVKFNDAVFEACRAAMLQGAEGEPTDDERIMAIEGIIPVADLSEANVKGWIPCSERMPDVGDIVLTAIGGSVNVGEMERSGANYRYFTSIVSGRELPATHWMPLPAAPQQEAK